MNPVTISIILYSLFGSISCAFDHADISQYPYVVSIEGIVNTRLCSGVIISEYHVLTDINFCLNVVNIFETVHVRYNSSFSSQGGTTLDVSGIYAHPNYNDSTNENDVAILEVVSPFVFDSVVQPVILPDYDFRLSNGTILTIAGWSYNVSFYLNDDHLVAVNVSFLDWNDCYNNYYQEFISHTQVCAICADEDGDGACLRDGGAALVSSDNVLIGTYFFQISAGEPAIFTNVSSVLDFVNDVINGK